MPEETTPGRHLHHALKGLSKHNWKGKIFSHGDHAEKEANEKSRVTDDVDDFLRPSANPTATSRPANAPPSHQLGRIDTASASRWPAATSLNASEHMQATVNTKRKRKKGLAVNFSEAAPEIIGEGGDEADTPTRDVSRFRAHSHPSYPPQMTIDAAAEHNPVSNSSIMDEGMVSRMATLRLASTSDTPSGTSHFQQEFPLYARGQQSNPTHNAVPGNEAEDPASLVVAYNTVERRRSTIEHAQVVANMRAEEGMAFHHARSQSFADQDNDDDPAASAAAKEDSPAASSFLSVQTPSSGQPLPSPQYSPHSMLPWVLAPSAHQNLSSAVPAPQQPFGTSNVNTPGHQPAPSAIMPAAAAAIAAAPTVSSPVVRKPALTSWRTAAAAVGDDALETFSSRVQHLSRVFPLAAESVRPLKETTFQQWIRACTWWFVRGRTELEIAIRSRPSTPDWENDAGVSLRSKQSFVDLAKAWWILERVAPEHPEVRRYGSGSIESLVAIVKLHGDHHLAELLEQHLTLQSKFRALTLSMKRNRFLPPDADQPLLAQGLSTTIWIDYPSLAPEISGLLSAGGGSGSLKLAAGPRHERIAELMPLGDTTKFFDYGRMFVDVSLTEDGNPSADITMPCLLSIVREVAYWQLKLIIASQSDLLNISIQSRRELGPTWEDVIWRHRYNVLLVDLPVRGVKLHVQFQERDFKTLQGIFDHVQQVERILLPEPDEELVFSETLSSFRYLEADRPSARFPDTPPNSCRVSLFEKQISVTEGSGVRRLHRGHRLLVVTSPKIKTLGSINQRVGYQQTIQFNWPRSSSSGSGGGRSEAGETALQLKTSKDGKPRSMRMVFRSADEPIKFLSLLNRSFVQHGEMVLADVPLRGLAIARQQPNNASPWLAATSADPLSGLAWRRLKVINRDPDDPDRAHGQTVRSDALRICAESAFGMVTDRVNLGPGQMQIRLEVGRAPELKVYRPPQEDMTISIAEGQVKSDVPERLDALLQAISVSNTIRTFSFNSLEDLHTFQAAMTGFTVLYDGVVTSFAISRRRMVVPIYKRWEASATRLQVVQQAKQHQLLAFFEDFSHGRCMNFQLKGTDAYEGFIGRAGKPTVRLVDAKFALPRGEPSAAAAAAAAAAGAGAGAAAATGASSAGASVRSVESSGASAAAAEAAVAAAAAAADSRDFVCLDLPDYPGEHDDIHIVFESREDAARFEEALPAPVSRVSRMASLRK